MILNLEGILNDMAEKKNKNLMRKKKLLLRGNFLKLKNSEIKKMKHQELVEIKKMEFEELIHVKREKLQLKRMMKELEITMMDTTNLDPKQ